MNKFQERILSLYRKQPNAILSTGEILQNLEISSEAKDSGSEKFLNQDQKKQLQRQKAKMHRTILYHLNLLVSEGVLNVVKRGNKGEKHFELGIKEGEELTVGIRKKLIKIAKPQMPDLPIKPFEDKDIVKRQGSDFATKLDSVMFECSIAKGLDEFEAQIEDVVNIVSDVIALNDFDFLFRKHSQKELIEFCDSLEVYAKDFRKKFCFIVSNITSELSGFLSVFCQKGYEHIAFVFSISLKSMHGNKKEIEKLVKIFADSSVTFHLLNKDVQESPIYFGDFGLYSIDKDDWQRYSQGSKLPCFAVSHASLNVDVEKFYKDSGIKLENFMKFLLKCSETLLAVNTIQRNNALEYFESLVNLDKERAKDIFNLAKNYIRFANFKSLNERFDKGFDLFLLNKTNETLKEYSASEETIFISCGMPTRFRVSISSLERETIVIKNAQDYNSEEVKEMLRKCEKYNEVFKGELPLVIKRDNEAVPEDVFNEINFLINNYSFPFITYAFKKTKGVNLKLSDFV